MYSLIPNFNINHILVENLIMYTEQVTITAAIAIVLINVYFIKM
jgi:hypothetical protein